MGPTTEVYERVSGASSASRARIGIDDLGGETTCHLDKTLANWVFRARRGQLTKLGECPRPMTELEA